MICRLFPSALASTLGRTFRSPGAAKRCLVVTILSAGATGLIALPHARAALPTILVDSLGAVPDGKTDSRAAIQLAFAKVRDAGGGIVRFRSDSTYYVSATIGSENSLDRLQGVTVQGRNATLLCGLVRQPRPAVRLIGSSLRIQDLTIRFTTPIDPLNDPYIQGGDAIYIGGTPDRPEQGVTVERCRINGSWFAGVRPIWASNVIVRANTISGCLATSIFAGDVVANLQILNNVISGGAEDGIYVLSGRFTSSCRGVTITGNTVTNSQTKGIGVGGVYDAYIAKNTIDTTWAPAIVCEQTGFSPDLTRNVRVSANIIRNPGTNYGPGRMHATVSPVAAGIYIAGSPGDFTTVQVDGNQVSASGGHGIVVADSTELKVTGNTVSNCPGMGILIGSEATSGPHVVNYTLAQNKVSNVGRSGYYIVNTNRGKVANNTAGTFGAQGSTIDRGLFVYRSNLVYSANNTITNDRNVANPVLVASSTSCPILTGIPSVTFGNSYPTSGRWSQSAMVLNNATAAGTAVGWQCMTGGSPGVWGLLDFPGW